MKIGIVGRVAEGEMLFDGQTIKTRVLKNELLHQFPDCEISVVETYNIKKRILHLVSDICNLLRNNDCIFVLLSENGRKVIFPILYYLNKIYKKPIYHDLIGGQLAKEVCTRKNWKRYINSFSVNWVELPSLQQKLLSLGVTNAKYLPNFKRIPIVEEQNLSVEIPTVFRFCTFSRVVKTKGITTAIEAIHRINEIEGKKIASVDVYGEVDSAYKEEFESLLKQYPNEVCYCGAVSFDKSVETIKSYYMLLFPTRHPGEGFPGTFIDAFAAGLPVIASDWNYNAELIKNGVTGWCYPIEDKEAFIEKIMFSIHNPNVIFEMKKECLREADIYKPETVMAEIKKQLISDGVCSE